MTSILHEILISIELPCPKGKDLLQIKLQQLLQNAHMSSAHLVKRSILTRKFLFKYKFE